MNKGVVVVTGCGGMGVSIARRLGPGRAILMADVSEDSLARSAQSLLSDGHDVTTCQVDVADPDSLQRLADTAQTMGAITTLVHTAGLSPVQASAAEIIAVDLVGVATVLEVFGEVISSGGAGVVIASMAGHLGSTLTPEEERQLASMPSSELANLPILAPDRLDHPGLAYAIAKRANQLRVEAASVPWGKRGARVNSISPGIISTPMGLQELSSGTGSIMRAMIDMSAAGLPGTPEDIASAVAFLVGPESRYITGTDLLVDGGVVAGFRNGQLAL